MVSEILSSRSVPTHQRSRIVESCFTSQACAREPWVYVLEPRACRDVPGKGSERALPKPGMFVSPQE